LVVWSPSPNDIRTNQFHIQTIAPIPIRTMPKLVEMLPAVPKMRTRIPATTGAAIKNHRVARTSTFPDYPKGGGGSTPQGFTVGIRRVATPTRRELAETPLRKSVESASETGRSRLDTKPEVDVDTELIAGLSGGAVAVRVALWSSFLIASDDR
jgi:hypothetical protein